MLMQTTLQDLAPKNWKPYAVWKLYELNELDQNSIEYNKINKMFTGSPVLRIERIQNLYELGKFLFRIEEKKLNNKISSILTVDAFHPIYDIDLDTCLQTSLDHQKYSERITSCDNFVKLYETAQSAITAFPQQDRPYNMIIIVCKVIDKIENIERLTDYIPTYAVFIDKNSALN